jgi:CRP-like cAMP-binding protein
MASPEVLDVLYNCELFGQLDEHEIEKIADIAEVETYAEGESILNQGDLCDKLYVIAQGHVFLERSVDLGTRQGTAIIGLLGTGRALDCWPSLLEESHALLSSAVCRRPTKVIAIKGVALREMLLQNPQLGFKVLERLCCILRDRIQAAFGAMENL